LCNFIIFAKIVDVYFFKDAGINIRNGVIVLRFYAVTVCRLAAFVTTTSKTVIPKSIVSLHTIFLKPKPKFL